jgi:hypothetical protein
VRRVFYDNPPPGTRIAMLAARERAQARAPVAAPARTLAGSATAGLPATGN